MSANLVKYAMGNPVKRDVFDFELGYLTKSPCLDCEFSNNRPKCHDTCSILDKIQTHLARGISSQARLKS